MLSLKFATTTTSVTISSIEKHAQDMVDSLTDSGEISLREAERSVSQLYESAYLQGRLDGIQTSKDILIKNKIIY